MKKEIIKYCFLTVILALVLGLVYPTIYRYDKYDQKIPVRINRVTGVTEFLRDNGWSLSMDEIPKKSEMQMFTEKMDLELTLVKHEIENEIVNKLSDEVTASINDKLIQVEKEIGEYKKSQLDPNNSFTKGSSMELVKKIMGPPNSMSDYGRTAFWNYGNSQVNFEDGKVTGWNISDVKLNVK